MQFTESTSKSAPGKYDIRKVKATNAQALNTRLFYDLTWINKISATSVFSDLFSNYDLVAHIQRANVPKEPIICTLLIYRTWFTQSAPPRRLG